MTSNLPTIDDLCAQRGWTLLGPAVREGLAQRSLVSLEDGDGLLYVWQDELIARRASYCHGGALGEQLFVVPAQIESGLNWVLVEAIEGRTIADTLGDGDLTDLNTPYGAAMIQSLGENVRKIHSVSVEATFGDVIEETGERWLTFNGYVAAHFERFSEDVRSLDIDDTTAMQINNRIGQMRHDLASFHPRSPSSVVHGRLALEHIWIDEHGREVVGITGFENAAILPPEVDLAWLLWFEGFGQNDSVLRSFYRGYGAARTMDVQRRERFYRRLRAFQGLFHAIRPTELTQEELVELTDSVVQ